MNTAREHGELSEAQGRHLSATCVYIDKLLCEIEQILDQSSSKSAFPRHIFDITPAQGRGLKEHIGRIREQLLRALGRENITRDAPGTTASHAVATILEFMDNAIEELKPRHMQGYGAISEGAAEKLNGTVNEFRSAVQSMGRYLRWKSEVASEPGDSARDNNNAKPQGDKQKQSGTN